MIRSSSDLARFLHEARQVLAPAYHTRIREETLLHWEALPMEDQSLMTEAARMLLDALREDGWLPPGEALAADADASEFQVEGQVLESVESARPVVVNVNNSVVLDEGQLAGLSRQVVDAFWARLRSDPA